MKAPRHGPSISVLNRSTTCKQLNKMSSHNSMSHPCITRYCGPTPTTECASLHRREACTCCTSGGESDCSYTLHTGTGEPRIISLHCEDLGDSETSFPLVLGMYHDTFTAPPIPNAQEASAPVPLSNHTWIVWVLLVVFVLFVLLKCL